MNYPQGPWGPPQGQPQQGGWGQPDQNQGWQQPQNQWAPPQQVPQGGGDYDFATLYGMADHSAGYLFAEGWYDAVVEESAYGRSKDGSKGQWTVKFRTTSGADAGRSPLTTTISISPKKNDGTDNAVGLGIMFRHLAALGVPVPDPADPSKTLNGPQPFWIMGISYDQVAASMVGRPVRIKVVHDEYDSTTRNKIRDIRPAQAGNTALAQQQPQQAQGWQPQGPSQQPQQAWGQPPAQQGPPPGWQGQQAPQGPPQGGPGAPPWAQGPQQAPAAGGWQQGPPAPQAPQQMQGQPPVPGAPPWAQPGQPGAGGTAEFTPQGQSQQPGVTQQPGQSGPPQLPWNQQAGAAPQQGFANGGPQQAPQGQAGPGDGPAAPMPWMQ
jgi:hypothetical protein